MIDNLTTVRRMSVQHLVGGLTSEQLAAVERALLTFPWTRLITVSYVAATSVSGSDHRSTRSARSVFHRLGRPSPSSMAK